MNAFSCPHCGRFIGKEPHGPGYCTPDRSAAKSQEYDKWAAETETQLEAALGALRDPSGTIDDVLSAITLGELAYRIGLGERGEDEWPDEVEPECICPPELVARGGFKGGCPVHALA